MKKINLTPYIKAAADFDTAFRIRRDASEDAPTAAELAEAKAQYDTAEAAVAAARADLISVGGQDIVAASAGPPTLAIRTLSWPLQGLTTKRDPR